MSPPPHGGAPWWRALTALLVQTSGWLQLTFDLAAIVVIAPVAPSAGSARS
ncbi:hypothetical protein ACFYZ9_03290 [Streptomyces sp. NPDC001691]|uniref:hypothetical protein n=1 Tax=Streptomyces sp. NPDC001691 TaxID=3364600 RepID=UPI0036A69179